MDIIKEIVQNILIIVLLNMLLEMLMPRSDLSRYIKLVMGLFIIVAVLNPVLNFVDKDLSIMTLFPVDKQEDELKSLLQKGQDLAKEKKQEAMEDYNDKVARQVMALAELNGKSSVQKVVVKSDEDPESSDYGSIKEIILYMGKPVEKDGSDSIIESIEINVGNSDDTDVTEQDTAKNPEVENLQRVLADFYAVEPSEITIIKSGE